MKNADMPDWKIMPMRKMGNAAMLVRFTTGTMAERTCIGA